MIIQESHSCLISLCFSYCCCIEVEKRSKTPRDKLSASLTEPSPRVRKGNGHRPVALSDDYGTQDDDNVSESGTYTIDSDNPSKDLIEARQNIDEVFGIKTEKCSEDDSDADTDKDVSDEIEEEVATVENLRKVGKHGRFLF